MITVSEYKAATGQVGDHRDAAITAAITSASALIRAHTGLEFAVSGDAPIATSRDFEYDGTGYLDIDECQAITGVTVGASSLSADSWSAYPLNGPVKTWLRLAEAEEGFKPYIVTVTAAWGWPVLPDDVKQAVVWTVTDLLETERPFTQEAIEGYSRTRSVASTEEPIPLRAQAALQVYVLPRI